MSATPAPRPLPQGAGRYFVGPVDIAGDRPIVGYAMAARHSSTPLARRAGEMWGSRSRRQHARGVDFAVYDAIDIEIEPHSHEDRHLIFVMGGHYVTSASGAPPVCATPVLVDNPAGTTHRDRFLGPQGRFLAVNIDPDKSWEGPATARRDRAAIARMTALLEDMEFDRPTLATEELAAALVTRDDPEGDRPAFAPERSLPWLDKAWQMVIEEDIDAIDLDSVEREAGLHPNHVARSFRTAFGRTAGQLLNDRRFENACRMLADRGSSQVDIALALGFCDQAHFANFFRRRCGMTPGTYRKLRRDV